MRVATRERGTQGRLPRGSLWAPGGEQALGGTSLAEGASGAQPRRGPRQRALRDSWVARSEATRARQEGQALEVHLDFGALDRRGHSPSTYAARLDSDILAIGHNVCSSALVSERHFRARVHCEPLVEHASATRDSGHYGPNRHADDLRDLGVQTFDVPQPDGLAKCVGEGVKRGLQVRIKRRARQELLGCVILLPSRRRPVPPSRYRRRPGLRTSCRRTFLNVL